MRLQPIQIIFNGQSQAASLVEVQRVDHQLEDMVRSHQIMQHSSVHAMLFTCEGLLLQCNPSAKSCYLGTEELVSGGEKAEGLSLDHVLRAMEWAADTQVNFPSHRQA